ncbi:MAG: bifunctional [glutamate--ammonia ligase]-adenylyl-L-tyrosine phosphorylase/[glutamate--ammonia-ligase] adenylyltransferase [Chthoniobacterales bacterium]
MTWAAEKAKTTLNPAQVENTLESLWQSWPADAAPLPALLEEFPLGEPALLHLLALSSICAARITRDPSLLLWLAQPEVSTAERGYAAMLDELHADPQLPIAANNFRALRLWKGREMTRIALREIAGAARLSQTMAELSQLAEVCVGEVYRHWDHELRQRRGSPSADFAILGLGKLGGRELNHSSDIDVVFLYSEEGQLASTLTYHQWFNVLAEKIVETFSATESAGSLFRIDLRLRPEGTAGPLARSLESMENYYAGFGETWERLALVKARGIAGSRELAYEFLRQHQPFIFPKSPSRDLLDEVAAVKRRIERDIVGHEQLERNVKLGTGGIREVEFIVQALQLLHGARHAFLQEQSTLRALPIIAELELLQPGEARTLELAYRFLRTVEHRLQIEAEQQTHTIPKDPETLSRLARSLDFASASAFLDHVSEQMLNVRAVFTRVIAEPARDAEPEPQRQIFRDEKAAARSIAGLARGRSSFHVAPRTRQVFRRLEPLLLQQLAGTADPDATLNQFARFVDAYGLRSMLFELLAAHPRLLELLVKTFDSSRYAGDLLIRRPQLLEEITRGDQLDRSLTVEQHLRRIEALHLAPASLDPLRIYRHTQTLRILLRDVLGLADLSSLVAELSNLAEASLLFVNHLRGSESDLTIIALGKFGGSELSYGADLDVMFVGENVRAAQHLLVAMAQPTAEGSVYTLDARLRPDGVNGPLTGPLDAVSAYYDARAQLWELQALTRARPICGTQREAFLEVAKALWRRAGERRDLFAELNSMAERIHRERSGVSEELDFKTGRGGLIAAEFLVQGLQMRNGVWSPNSGQGIAELAKCGAIKNDDAEAWRRSYDYLRRVELVLRRYENKSVSALPPSESEQRLVAHRIGAKSLDQFAGAYREARNTIYALYSRYLLG